MSRLTEKINEFDYKLIKYNDIVRANARQKLGQLEDSEEELDCPLEEIIELIKLLKKYYYVEITGKLVARTIWNNVELNEEELYKINHIFNKIKDKSE